ncbi:hypothetical protein C2S51_011134 [Perilla frutescens var. frutescens]|nr:hypothetical protein C2S51_011134 [Perilla frutescens var. frutescens]
MKKALFGGKIKQLGKKLLNIKKQQVPRGCFPVDVVGGAETEAIRYIVSIEFLKSGCFKRLLDEHEEEIRLHTRGAMTLPCPVHRFEEAIYRDRINSRMVKI